MFTARKSLKLFALATLLFTVVASCGSDDDDPAAVNEKDTALASLPEDTGGTHTPYLLGSTKAAFGYYLYLPGGYDSKAQSYPLLVFLHGKAERGDGTKTPSVLDKVLNNGIPKLIKNGQWDPTYPMIVVSPQFHGTEGNLNNWGGGDPALLKNFIKYMIDNYKVNINRIYLTGLSHGGNGVYDYISSQADTENYIAAAVPVAAYGASKGYDKSKNTPIWAFVGDQDVTNFNTTKTFITNFNAQVPAPSYKAKLSIFEGGHDVWTRTYSGSGIGTANANYDPFNETVYDWMFKYKRNN